MATNEYDDLLSGQPAEQQVDDYDAAVQLYQNEQRTKLGSSLAGAVRVNPDQYAKARALSSQTGIPAEVVHRNLPEVSQQGDYDTALAAATSSPVLANHAAQDPEFAKVASDDMPLLAQIGNSISRGWRSLKEFLPTAQLTNSASLQQQIDAIDRGEDVPLGVVGEQYKDATPDERKIIRQQILSGLPEQIAQSATQVAQLESEKRQFAEPGTVTAAFSAPTWLEAFKRAGRHPLDFLASTLPEGVVGSLPGMALSVPASAAGPGGSAVAFGATSALQTVGPSILDELGRQGVNTTDPQALAQAMQNPAISGPVIDKALKHAGIAGLFGAASGGLASRFGIKINVPGQAVLGATQPVAESAATGEPTTPGSVIAGALSGALAAPGEVASTILGRTRAIISRAAEPVVDTNAMAHKAVADAQTLATVSEQAAASKLRERDPQSFQDFTERAVTESGGTAPEHVYVSAPDLDKAIEQAKITPEQIEQLAPSVGKQIAIAQLAGADVQIPFTEFATHLAGTPLGDALLPHLRTGPEALNLAEVEGRNPVVEFSQEVQNIVHGDRVDAPLFRSADEAGMTPAEFAEYLNHAAVQPAVDQLQARTLRDMRYLSNAKLAALQELRADAEAKRAAVEQEVTPQVQAEPVYAATRFIKQEKLNTGSLRDIYGDDPNAPWRYLPSNMLSKEGGLHPNTVAEMHGFDSGDRMVRAILEASPEKEAIDSLTDQRVLERYGDLADPKRLERAAEASIAHEARARTLAREIPALNKAMGSATELARGARQYAEAHTAQQRVRDLVPGQFTVAEARAARKAMEAWKRGDTAAAAVARREQLIANRQARATIDAKDEVQSGLQYLRKFDSKTTREAINVEYRDQIDALLDRYDLRSSVSNTALDKRESLAAFKARMDDMGYEPDIPAYLLNEANRQHYRNMTVEQFRGLVDAVKSIEHLGRLKNKLLDVREQRELDTVAAEAANTMKDLPGKVGAQSNRGLTRIEKKWATVKAAGRSLGASLLKMEQMMDWLDARDPNGVFNRVVFKRIADAGSRENDLQLAMSARWKTLVHAMPKDMENRSRIFVADNLIDSVTGQPSKFTKKEMLALAGNVGNDSNLQKVLAGEQWNEAALWDFLHKNMTKADWDFVQGIGDSFESLWPEKLAMSRRLGATNPPKIEPRPFQTPHGEYKGWYWPMVYDPARSQDVAERGARSADSMFENIYRRANTDTGRMNARKEAYARPVLYNLDAIPRLIRDEIHDLAYREAVIDAGKFLSNGQVRDGIIEALGREYYDQLPKWLQSIAGDKAVDGSALAFWEGLAHKARVHTTIAGLGFRLTTMLVHGTSAGLESVAELGPKWFASGLADFRNPVQWRANRDFVFERSPEMAHRMNEVDRDIREHLRELDLRSANPATSAVTRGLDFMKGNAYYGIAMLDMATALPTWMGAYKKAMTPTERGGLGMSEEQAAYFADKTVRNAHGGTGAKDLAAVQRGSEFFKLLTMFYSFWNHNVNRLMDTARLARGLPTSKNFRGDLGRVMMRTLIYTLGVQLIHASVQPNKQDDNEGWGAWAARELALSATAGIPVARDIAAAWLDGRDYSVTPAASAVQALTQSGHDAMLAAAGEETSSKWLKHAANTVGYVFGLPIGQAGASAQFLWDVGEGRQQPQDIADWWNGLLHGDMHTH